MDRLPHWGHCRLGVHLKKLGLKGNGTSRFFWEGGEMKVIPINLLNGYEVTIQGRFRLAHAGACPCMKPGITSSSEID